MREQAMRNAIAVLTLTLILGTASMAPAAEESRDARIVAVRTEKARKLMRAAAKTGRSAARLRHLEQATQHLERAYRLDREAAKSDLAVALNGITRIHLERRALKRAARFNARARKVDASNAAARRLAGAIRAASEVDLNDQFDGATALRRLAQRRAAQGMPYRPRGFGRRR